MDHYYSLGNNLGNCRNARRTLVLDIAISFLTEGKE